MRARVFAVMISHFASGCDPGGPNEPEPMTVSVTVTTSAREQPTGPLRLAVVWRYDAGAGRRWLSTYDAPLLSQGLQVITLTMPSASQRVGLTDLATVNVRCTNTDMGFEVPVVLPRVVVYEDLDGSMSLDVDAALGGGVDRIWGITDKTFVPLLAFRDLDQFLSTHPLEAAECLRKVTNNQYSAFLQGRYASGYLWPTAAPISLFVHLTDTDQARVALYCGFQSENSLISPTDVLYEPPQHWVDSRLPEDVCATSKVPCVVGDSESLSLPDTSVSTEPGHVRTAHCYVNEGLDVLLVSESRLVCQACRCSWKGRTSRWIVDHSLAPTGWPCGTRVQYCSTPVAPSLWDQLPASCRFVYERPL